MEVVDEESTDILSPSAWREFYSGKSTTIISPVVSMLMALIGPVPAPLTAATETVYVVDGVSPEIVACLAATSTSAVPTVIPWEFVVTTW